MALTENQVVNLIKSVIEDRLQEQKQLGIESFKTICKNYIQAVEREIDSLRQKQGLMERVAAIGRLMHNDESEMQKMLILSHAFELAFNQFLGRKIPLTWVTNSGKIFIASQETIVNLYASATSAVRESNTSGKIYTGKIRGIRQGIFQQQHLDPELQRLQNEINKSAQNKRQVFKQAKRRYQKSRDMQYANEDAYKSMIQNIYWNADTSDGNPKNWSGKISSAGYIGEGYVAMVLNMAHETAQAVYPTKPPYDSISQYYIEVTATLAQEGDAIPGIIQGDIKANDSGSIQLAIKQGNSFSAASISGNIAIAYAFILTPQIELLSKENIQAKINEIGEKWKSASWQKIFQAISGQVVQEIKLPSIIINI